MYVRISYVIVLKTFARVNNTVFRRLIFADMERWPLPTVGDVLSSLVKYASVITRQSCRWSSTEGIALSKTIRQPTIIFLLANESTPAQRASFHRSTARHQYVQKAIIIHPSIPTSAAPGPVLRFMPFPIGSNTLQVVTRKREASQKTVNYILRLSAVDQIADGTIRCHGFSVVCTSRRQHEVFILDVCD